jgi:hypothetical protein
MTRVGFIKTNLISKCSQLFVYEIHWAMLESIGLRKRPLAYLNSVKLNK